MLLVVQCVAVLGLTPEHAQRLAAALRKAPIRGSYRRGSNRVPNGSPVTTKPDLSSLDQVLDVSIDDATVLAEPGVTMEQLVAATLPRGLAPKVVPEFRDITVGGAINGGAMESGSFAHGMFHDTVCKCELLFPNGTVATVSRSQQSELLAAIGGSYGSLATLTAAMIECVRLPACGVRPPRVALRFEWHDDASAGVAALSALARTGLHAPGGGARVDFLDGVALPAVGDGPGGGGGGSGGVLVCAARLLEEGETARDDEGPGEEVWAVDEAGSEFYYERLLTVRSRLAAAADPTLEVTMGLEQYFFRYDRGAFQIGAAALWLASWRDWLTPTKLLLSAASARRPLNLRLLCDPLFRTGTMYRRLHLAPPEAIASRLVLQDLFVPAARAAEAIALCQGLLTEPPCAVWLWPVRGTDAPVLFAPNGHVRGDELLINLGVYSRAPRDGGGGVEATRALERWGLANGGRKLLYSANYYEPDELWANDVAPHMYSRARYEALRERLGADADAEQPRADLPERVSSMLRGPDELTPLDAAGVAFAEWLL